MSKIERMKARIMELEESASMAETRKKPKTFKFPGNARRIINKGRKSPDSVVTQYLTQKRDINFKLCKVVSGNLIVVNNKVHKLNPKYLWRYGKNFWYIHREIDREPVSNEDYDELRERHRDTDADVPLIKAVLGAINKPSKAINKNVGIIILIALVVGVIGFALFG